MNDLRIKQELQLQQETLNKRIKNINKDFMKGRSADFSEQASETENDDVLRTIRAEAETELSLIRTALTKLQHDEYGYCQRCQEPIAEARLEVLPYAEFCIKCSN